MKSKPGLYLIIIFALCIQSCASGSKDGHNEKAIALEDSDTSKRCNSLAAQLSESYPLAQVRFDVQPDSGFVKCSIYMEKAGVFQFFISQPLGRDPDAMARYEQNRKDFREMYSVTGSKFVISGNAGTCFWNQTGFMSRLQLKWKSMGTSEEECVIAKAPPSLQRGYELVKGEFVFP